MKTGAPIFISSNHIVIQLLVIFLVRSPLKLRQSERQHDEKAKDFAFFNPCAVLFSSPKIDYIGILPQNYTDCSFFISPPHRRNSCLPIGMLCNGLMEKMFHHVLVGICYSLNKLCAHVLKCPRHYLCFGAKSILCSATRSIYNLYNHLAWLQP